MRASASCGRPFSSGAGSTGASRSCRPSPATGARLAATAGGAALEPLDPAAGVHQLLLAGVERMARRADLHVKLGLRGARIELVAARAAHVRECVLGVDPSL